MGEHGHRSATGGHELTPEERQDIERLQLMITVVLQQDHVTHLLNLIRDANKKQCGCLGGLLSSADTSEVDKVGSGHRFPPRGPERCNDCGGWGHNRVHYDRT